MTAQFTAKCRVEGSRLILCSAIEPAVEVGGQGARRQGLKMTTRVHLETDRTRQALALISGDYGRGVLVNYCPFCGEKIVTTFDEKGA
jgi:hypothetical protein